MECPTCHKGMRLVTKDTSTGERRKRYDRKVFRCTKDDSWATIEIPQEEKTE